MKFRITYFDKVIKEDIPQLPKSVKQVVKSAIEQRLTIDPVGLGKPLRYSLSGHRRLRVGSYRVIYRIDLDEHVVLIVAIKHRKNVYN